MRVWIDQDPKQVSKHGDSAPWRVRWYQNGRQKCKTIGSKSKAQKYARRLEGELNAGLTANATKKRWSDFVSEYLSFHSSRTAPRTQTESRRALSLFDQIVMPGYVTYITTRDVDKYVNGRKNCDVSPATINKELRHLRAVFRRALAYKYIAAVPEITFLPEDEHEPRYVTSDHFRLIYLSSHLATQPQDPGPWWRAITIFIWFTGWRIEQVLLARKSDLVDGHIKTRAADNKGSRDFLCPLHPEALRHLQALPEAATLFPWPCHTRHLWRVFHALQARAGLQAPFYGFHDLRRSFATYNAAALGPDLTQKLMQHQSYQTTKLYISLAHRLDDAVSRLYVPDLRPKPTDGTKS